MWHIRVDDADAMQTPGPYRPSVHAVAFGRDWVGDSRSGRLGVLTRESWGDFEGRAVERVRTMPHFQSEFSEASFHELKFDMQVDSGLAAGDVADIAPEVRIDWSFDGGETFRRVVKRQLRSKGKGAHVSSCGSGTTFTPRIRTRTLAPVSVYGGYVDVRQGRRT